MMTNNYGWFLTPELQDSPNKPLIMAHRGSRDCRPENSFAAFDLALEQGADILETDLRVTSDEDIVCFHDETIDDLTYGSGKVAEKTVVELKKWQLKGNGYPEPQYIPTLRELFEEYLQKTVLALELKKPVFQSEKNVDLLVKILEEFEAVKQVLIISFDKKALELVAKRNTDIDMAHIAKFRPWPEKEYGFAGTYWPWFYLNPFYVRMAHKNDQKCCPLDPTPEKRVPYYLKKGVDVLITDNPGKTIQAVEDYRRRQE